VPLVARAVNPFIYMLVVNILCASYHDLVMRMARPTSPFALTPSDHVVLQGWLRMSTLEQSLALRARILLLLADGLTPKVIS
jgi:hypothetical protein